MYHIVYVASSYSLLHYLQACSKMYMYNECVYLVHSRRCLFFIQLTIHVRSYTIQYIHCMHEQLVVGVDALSGLFVSN